MTELLTGVDGITAFSTLREAADPADPYSGFTTCHYVGDRPEHVGECRRRLAGYVQADRFVFPRQTHSLNVAIVDHPDFPDPEETDALVTALPRIALCIHTADCVPLVMADPEAGVIAAVHSGWRGTVGGIAARTVEVMAALGADPRRIVAAIGPCIGPECFEVGSEVVEAFLDAGFPERIVDRSRPKPHIDLRAAVVHTLRQSGVTGRIDPPRHCSRCNPMLNWSARALGTASGRTLTSILRH